MTIHSSGKNWKPFVREAALEVDAKFPRNDWTSTYPGHGENSPVGAYAIDFMCNKTMGDKITAYLVANRKRLGIRYIIWYRRWINWGTDGENAKWKAYFDGWNSNPSRAHTNHVHVSFEVNGKYVPLAKPVTMYTKEDGVKGYSFDGKVVATRKKGYKLTGTPRTSSSGKYLVTSSNVWYAWPRLTSAKPTTTPVTNKPPVVKPQPKPVYPEPKVKVMYLDRLKPGVTNSDSVYLLQSLLNKVNVANVERNGKYDAATEESVRVFQKSLGWDDQSANGKIGPASLRELIKKAGKGYQYKVEASSK